MIKKFFYKIFCGFFLGLSIFAPGFSGSVVAIIMGVYQDLIRIASNPFKKLKENILFCLPLGIGALISGVLFIFGFEYLFETYEKATYLLFVGLIAGNLPIIYQDVRKSGFKMKYSIGGVIAFAVALVFGLLAVGDSRDGLAGFTAGLPLLAVSGFAAGMGAFVPGMSVSMILIITGVYEQLIFAARTFLNFKLTYLFPFAWFGLFVIIGLVVTSRGIKALFDKAPGLANTAVFGFVLGSLVGVLVQTLRSTDTDFNWYIGAIMLAVGLLISMLFVILGKRMNKNGE